MSEPVPLVRRTTITDVARTAGTSIATVSKVLNGRPGVGPETRSRVMDAVDALGYISSIERQNSLRRIGEMTIEVVVEPADTANPYLTTFLGGALEMAAASGVALVLRPLSAVHDISPTSWANSVVRAGRIGVIEVTSEYSSARENAVRAVGLPMILVDPIDKPRPSTLSIGATNWAGAYEATRHLLELGHRRISYIGGPPKATCDVVRAHGWAAAMMEAGIRVDLGAIPRGSYTFDHGRDAATELLSRPDRPTAIFAGSDASAVGVLEAARRLDVNVPAALSVVGFDDTYQSRTSTPPLTTVHQPIADIGSTAVATIARIANGDPTSTKRIEVATHLVLRQSTSAPPR